MNYSMAAARRRARGQLPHRVARRRFLMPRTGGTQREAGAKQDSPPPTAADSFLPRRGLGARFGTVVLEHTAPDLVEFD